MLLNVLINLQIFQYLYYAFTVGKNSIENIKKNKVPYICIVVIYIQQLTFLGQKNGQLCGL